MNAFEIAVDMKEHSRMFACVLNLKQEVRLTLESGHCKTMVRTSKVSHQGGSPPEPNNWHPLAHLRVLCM